MFHTCFFIGILLLFNETSSIYAKVLEGNSSPTKIYQGCSKSGQRINDVEGVIEYHFNPKASSSFFTVCMWKITAPQNHIVFLRIRSFKLGRNYKDCGNRDTTWPWLVVFNRPPDGNTLQTNWQCNMEKTPMIVAETSFLQIRFLGTPGADPTWFTLDFKAILKNNTRCPSNLTNLSATNQSLYILSPLFPNFPPTNQLCTWLITAPQDHVIVVWFSHFQIDVDDLCESDHVIVRDGVNSTSPVLAKLCGTDQRCPISSSGRYMWIHYRTDQFGRRNAFKGSYMAIKQDIMDTSGMATVKSLKYQGEFKVSITRQQLKRQDAPIMCLWNLTVPSGQIANISISTLDPEITARYACSEEHIDVIDGSRVQDRVLLSRNYTHSVRKTVVKSSGRHVLIRLIPNRKGMSCTFLIEFSNISENIGSTSAVLPTSIYPTTVTTPSTVDLKIFNVTNSTAKMKTVVRKSSQVSNNTVYGIGLGSTLGLAVLVALIFVFVRKRIRSKYDRIHIPCDRWEIVSSEVELIEEVGQGAFGKVWKGCISEEVVKSRESNSSKNQNAGKNRLKIQVESEKSLIVAVKMLHGDASLEEKREFLREIEFMKDVGYHRNIISMVACCTAEEQVFLVVEFAKHGDLLKLLREKRKKMCTKPSSRGQYGNNEQCTEGENDKHQNVQSLLNDFISISWQIAKGMEYLASKGIVHRDLAARNILVAEDLLVKVADFGLSRQVTYEDKTYKAEVTRKLPIKWMSPEAIFEQTFTTKSDVWSYGVVLWEIFSVGGAPYPTLTNCQLVHLLKKGHRMDKPDLCPDDIYSLTANCWHEHALERPSFSEIIEKLEILMTRDNPYVEFQGIKEDDECYLVPSFNSAPVENEESGDETTAV